MRVCAALFATALLLAPPAQAALQQQDASPKVLPLPPATGVPEGFFAERRGDDLVVFFPEGGKATLRNFMLNVREGQTAELPMNLSGKSRCVFIIDWQGKILSTRCDRQPEP